MSIIIIGLLVCVAIAVLIVLLVALPGLRSEGRIPDNESQNFRLPHSWTGFDDEDSVDGLFGREDEREYEPAGAFPDVEDAPDKRAAKKQAKAERAAQKSAARESAPAETPDDEPAPAEAAPAAPAAAPLASPGRDARPEQTTEPDRTADTGEAAEPEPALQLQSMRHALPPVWSGRPRTRHWRVPESGDGLKTAAKLLIG